MIPEQIPIKYVYGNNETTDFYFDFFIETPEQLKVTYFDMNGNQTVLTYGVDYIIQELNNISGSYITFPYITENYQSTYSTLAWDTVTDKKEKLAIELVLPIKQTAEYNDSILLKLKNLEKSYDYLTRICQILKRRIDETITVSGTTSNNLKLPEPLVDNFIKWAKDGTLENYDILAKNKEFQTELISILVESLKNYYTKEESDKRYLDEKCRYKHIQTIPSQLWHIRHGLNKECPNVVVVDSEGREYHPAVRHIDKNNCIVSLIGSMTGIAYLD